MRRSRTLLAFSFCLALGLAGGLAYAWLLAPAASSVGPDRLNPTDRQLYLRLVAAAYAADNDLDRAAARLAAAGPDAGAQLTALLADELRAGRPAADLAHLTLDLGLDAPAALLPPPQPLPPATSAAVVSPTPVPTGAVTVVLDRQPLCPGQATRRLAVNVVDETGTPVVGAVVTARRTDAAGAGLSSAFTGFADAGAPGTADFVMEPGAVYALALGGRVVADDLGVTVCPDGLEGGWLLVLETAREE